jgi:hypothetical protein
VEKKGWWYKRIWRESEIGREEKENEEKEEEDCWPGTKK